MGIMYNSVHNLGKILLTIIGLPLLSGPEGGNQFTCREVFICSSVTWSGIIMAPQNAGSEQYDIN